MLKVAIYLVGAYGGLLLVALSQDQRAKAVGVLLFMLSVVFLLAATLVVGV